MCGADLYLHACIIMYAVLNVTKHLSLVAELTSDVDHWYTLGVFLKISDASLKRIKQKYGGYTREGFVEMLRIWLETGQATWSDLVHALCEVGHTSLARKIATEIGKLLFFMTCFLRHLTQLWVMVCIVP